MTNHIYTCIHLLNIAMWLSFNLPPRSQTEKFSLVKNSNICNFCIHFKNFFVWTRNVIWKYPFLDSLWAEYLNSMLSKIQVIGIWNLILDLSIFSVYGDGVRFHSIHNMVSEEVFYEYIYSMIGLLICKNVAFGQEVSVESLILRWLLRPVGLLFQGKDGLEGYITLTLLRVCI